MILRAPYPDAAMGGAMRPWTLADAALKPDGWYDAQETSSMTLSGGNVMSMMARGGYGPTLTPSGTVGYDPTGFDGTRPALTSTGGSLQGQIATESGNTFTLMGVFLPSTGGNRCPIAIGIPDGGQGAGISWNASGFVNVFVWGQPEVDYTYPASAVILRGEVMNGMETLWVNGVNVGSVSASMNITSKLLSVANFATFPGANKVAEVAKLPGVYSASEGQMADGYLAWHNGLQGLLASDQPYKNSPPMVSA